MKYFRISATLLAPLAIQQERQSNAPMTLDYLPGSTLRGALAAQYLRRTGGPENERFRRLFIDSPVCFPNLMPTDNPMTLAHVLPSTAVSCKRQSGFASRNKHGVADRLAETAASRISGRPSDPRLWACPHPDGEGKPCDNDLKPFSGCWNADLSEPRKFDTAGIFQRHTGIDRSTGTVAQQIFYTSQAMAPIHPEPESGELKDQFLSGGLYLDDRQLEALRETIDEGTIFAGADRSRGFGELELALDEAEPPSFDLDSWNDRFQEKLDTLEVGDRPSGLYFSIKLESHAILVDDLLCPTVEMFDLASAFSGIQELARVAKVETVRGWQASWRLPKPDDAAVAMGSVYLFCYSGDDRKGLKDFLGKLSKGGIGLRREEGFGRISICDPLHVIEQEVI